MFEISEKVEFSDEKIARSSEGLYLLLNRATSFRHSPTSHQDIKDLALDSDYYRFQALQRSTDLQHAICHHSTNILKVISKFENEYIEINDIKGNPLILYAANVYLFIPQTWNAFLQKQKIIKRNSKLTYCQTINSILTVGNNFEIRRNGSLNSLQTQSILHYEKINLFKIQSQNLNFHHLHELIEGIDVLDESNKYIQVVEDSGNYVISSDTFKSAENFVVKPVHSLVDAANALATNTKKKLKNLIHIIFTIILSLTLIIFVLVILYFRRGIFPWLHRRHNRNQTALADVELNQQMNLLIGFFRIFRRFNIQFI